MLDSLYVNAMFNSVSYRIGEALVDPGDEWDGFRGVEAALLSHAHFDHIYGLNRLLELNPAAQVCTNAAGKEMLLNAKKNMSYYHGAPFVFRYPDAIRVVEDGEELELASGLVVKAIFTPGHNPSCITWVTENCVFSGDSLIPGIRTVTNLPGGDRSLSGASEERIRALALTRNLYPGHQI